MAAGDEVGEAEVAAAVSDFRRRGDDGYLGESFDAIAGAGANGAIVHYKAVAGSESHRTLDTSAPFLLDSGGQYLEGTTDVTRTVHFGTPTAHQREAFCRVLQGHIALDTCVWPADTPGFVLDAFARQPLWRLGLSYGHGTGHGVGACLNVHEGPASISARFENTQPLLPGMVMSNEPGYYEEGDEGFGIRIENLVVVVEAVEVEARRKKRLSHAPAAEQSHGCFLQFERLTMVPIQKSLVVAPLAEGGHGTVLLPAERDWLDTYHRQVWAAVSPRLQGEGDGAALAWLEAACAPLPPCKTLEEFADAGSFE